MEMNELLNNITNAEINKQELERELETLNKEYQVEMSELSRLNDKNLEYTSALNEQERERKLQDEMQQRQEDKQTLSNFVNELNQLF